MARPITRVQALENRAFLHLLRRTGNVRLACRELGLKYGTMQHRRRVQPAFAARWDAALVLAQGALEKKGRARKRGAALGSRFRGNDEAGQRADRKRTGPRPAPGNGPVFRTVAGEPHLVRLKDGKLQVRRAQAGKLTREAEQAFLAAVSATCNLSLAAAAVGSCFGAFNRRRKKDPAFARELRLALVRGYERLEGALLDSTLAESHEHGDWRSNDAPAIPPMSANQALQLMYLHQKAALLLDEPTPMRRRRGESSDACCERLALMAEARAQRSREEFEVAEAERWARGEPAWGLAGEDVRRKLGLGQEAMSRGMNPRDVDPLGDEAGGRPDLAGSSRNDARCAPLPLRSAASMLPDLGQVTGWSRADPDKVPHDPERALFGGWRIEDLGPKEGW